jgi:hypothetical protein
VVIAERLKLAAARQRVVRQQMMRRWGGARGIVHPKCGGMGEEEEKREREEVAGRVANESS